MALEVVIHPAKVLRRIARRIAPGDGIDLEQLYEQMLDTMDEHEGVGLAAPQIGQSIRLIVAHSIEKREDFAFINPQVLEGSEQMTIGIEGCLSLPNLYGDVERHESIKLRWQDFDFKTHEETFSGHFARVLQHEVDHLNGVLILDIAIGGLFERADDDEEEPETDGAAHIDDRAGEGEGQATVPPTSGTP